MMIPFRIILLSALLAVSLAAHAKRRRFNSEWLASGVHDHTCFTQGFSFINSTHILESCGLYGQSFYHILEFTLNDLNETTLV
jgi:glutamine cyclotransferase